MSDATNGKGPERRKTSSPAKYGSGHDAWMANVAADNKAKAEADYIESQNVEDCE